MNPPRAAYDAARRRTLSAVTALRYGVVTYDDVTYEAAVSVEGEGYDILDQGHRSTQRIKVTIAKRLLHTRPRKGATILHEGKAYEIDLVSGDNEGDPGWSFTAFRTPGADPE